MSLILSWFLGLKWHPFPVSFCRRNRYIPRQYYFRYSGMLATLQFYSKFHRGGGGGGSGSARRDNISIIFDKFSGIFAGLIFIRCCSRISTSTKESIDLASVYYLCFHNRLHPELMALYDER